MSAKNGQSSDGSIYGRQASPATGNEPGAMERNLWRTAVNFLKMAGKAEVVAIKPVFGLGSAPSMKGDTGEVSFKMARSPQGSLEILCLGEKLRITQGQRETVLVCERQS
ncbi:MAG: hypothetical protein HC890_00290 [Chloroflexaceae bacterium]|nr:hypothetical protein [Chloroflexaceae bacterium]